MKTKIEILKAVKEKIKTKGILKNLYMDAECKGCAVGYMLEEVGLLKEEIIGLNTAHWRKECISANTFFYPESKNSSSIEDPKLQRLVKAVGDKLKELGFTQVEVQRLQAKNDLIPYSEESIGLLAYIDELILQAETEGKEVE